MISNQDATTMTILRYYFTNEDLLPVAGNRSTAQLHVFADAYGVVAYLGVNNHTAFVIAKKRFASVKELTLPKLELMPAVHKW